VPQYDLDALSSRMGSMRGVRCDWGVVVPNPVYDDSVGLPVQEGLAGVIDVSDWSFRRGVTMGDRGAIQELELDSWVLARCRQGLEDVRLVSQGRQVPFILEKEGVSRSFALPGLLERDAVRPGVSRWRMELPDENIPVIRIACEVGTPFFDRVWKLYEEVEGSARGRSERLLDRGRWVRDLEDQGGVLWLSVGMRPRGRVLFLELDNGDNPELEIQSFSAYFRAPRLYFQAPAGGGVELVCGNRLVEAPVYDLALLAPQVMAARRVRAELGEVGEVSLGSTRNEVGGGAVTVFFWGVLILVVGGLSFLIMRLLPKESGEGE
jgi:hypothetical protein